MKTAKTTTTTTVKRATKNNAEASKTQNCARSTTKK